MSVKPAVPSRLSTLLPPSGGPSIEQRLALLESVIKVGSDGSVTIEGAGKVRIKSAGAVEIEGATSVHVRGAINVDVHAGSALTLKGSGTASLQGGMVRLNNGGRPVARVGDAVVTPSGPGTISAGEVTVMA